MHNTVQVLLTVVPQQQCVLSGTQVVFTVQVHSAVLLRKVQGGTALNNSPIEIHVKMSDFKTPFLCSGYIYCTFYTCDHFEHILIFNINLVTLGVKRIFFAMVPQRTPPISRIGRQAWWRTGRRVLDKRPRIGTIIYPFIFAGTYSLLHHSRIDLVMCPHKTASRWHVCHPNTELLSQIWNCFSHCKMQRALTHTHTKWLTHFIMNHPRITQFVHRVPQFVHRVDYSTLKWEVANIQ